MLRAIRIIVEIIAGLVGLVAVFGLILIWRLNSGPVQSSVTTPYLEAGIEGLVPGTEVQIAHALLSWDDATSSVALHVENLQIIQQNKQVIADVPNVYLRLNVVGILLGQFLPVELLIEHPHLKLERRSSGAYYFGGMVTEGSTSGDNESGANARDSLRRVAHNLSHAYFTHALRVKDAVLDVHDVGSKSDWSIHVPQIILERKEGVMTGDVTLDVTQKNKTSAIDIRYAYDKARGLHRLETGVADITPAFFAGGHPATLGLNAASLLNLPLTGEVDLGFDDDLKIASADILVHGGPGFLNDTNFWDKPRAIKSLDVKANYDRMEGQMELASAVIDFGGPTVTLSGSGKTELFSSHKFDIRLTAQIDNWPMDQYGELWPKPIIPNAREWIAANISKGKFDHGEAIFTGKTDVDDLDSTDIMEGSGKVTAINGAVKYMETMPPVEGTNAEANFTLKEMFVKITSGNVGDIRVEPFTLEMTDLAKELQYIDIPLKIIGPVPSVLKLIDYPPLGYAKKVGLTPEDVNGKVEGTVVFHFPLIKDLDVNSINVKAEADLTNISSSKLVKGIDISQAHLGLLLDPESFSLKGPATLNKVPFQITWKQNFSQGKGQFYQQMTLTGGVTAEQWRSLGIEAFNDSKGPIAVNLNVTQPDKTHTLYTGALDMTGVEVHIDQLNWKKPGNVAAGLKFTAEKGEDGSLDVTSIDGEGPGMNIKGHAVFSAKAQQISSLDLDPIIIGRTNATLHFMQPEDDKGEMQFTAEGKSFDVSGLKGGKDPEHADPRPKEYRINIGKLFTSDTGVIENAKGYAIRDTQGWSEISLHGMADGAHALDMQLVKKNDGSRGFVLTCDDFGKALKGLGFTDTVREGKVDIRGESDPASPRVINGTAEIGHFVVGHLPALAVLMNAASPFGFEGLFTDSMEFDNLKGKFRWEGNKINLLGIHAAGAAVGLNINGPADMNSGEANLHGTMVPFSMMNSVLNAIPLVGDLITGGKGEGVFAVSYTITGQLDDPHIGVNPISLLTPGFLRNLFFGGDDEEDDVTPEPAPKH